MINLLFNGFNTIQVANTSKFRLDDCGTDHNNTLPLIDKF